MSEQTKLIDPFGRQITYLRLSVTDRCNFRCVYCMAEDMTFLPKQRLLCYEELTQISQAFTELGVNKIRLTGGEPLVRHDIIKLTSSLGKLDGLNNLAITTNGSMLTKLAKPLYQSGVRSLNISLDTLDEEQFHSVTRTGTLSKVLDGIQAAKDAGFEKIKLNAVIMKGQNDQQIPALLDYVLDNELDISFIEEMPLGHISSHDRAKTFCSSEDVKAIIKEHYELLPSTLNTGGPSRYFSIQGHRSNIGFISPHSNNFCGSCNRIRLTAEGQLLLCLGNEDSLDLRAIVRRYPNQTELLKERIIGAIKHKPKEHHFSNDGDVQILRFMNMTGG
ncbi:GTP 3',8-cyclase MoaA [Kangiella sp.]|uniref:GTP 3',8-cyclase MoaA n=1 Tax=Kangiella sp. TaxID=1920245 RepID=UPI003A91DACC